MMLSMNEMEEYLLESHHSLIWFRDIRTILDYDVINDKVVVDYLNLLLNIKF